MPVFDELQGDAPQDIRADWRLVVAAVEALRDARAARASTSRRTTATHRRPE